MNLCLFTHAMIVVGIISSIPAQAPIAPPLAQDLPWLTDQSSWGQDLDLDSCSPKSLRRGNYPLGNGRILAILGQGQSASTLTKIRRSDGPPCQTRCELHLSLDDVVLRLPRQRIRRIRGANFVLSEDRGDDLSVVTLNYAQPGGDRITRIIEIRNTSNRHLEGLKLSAQLFDPEGMTLAMTASRRVAGRIHGDAFALAPGAIQAYVLEIAIPATLASETLPHSLQAALLSARTTWRWWRKKLATTTAHDTDRVKLRDLIEDWKVNLLVLRNARSGEILAPDHRCGASPRGGDLLLLLRLGLWAEARQCMEHRLKTRAASAWDTIEHYWYWRTTRDLTLVKEHWDTMSAWLSSAAPISKSLREASLSILAHHSGALLADLLGHSDHSSSLLEKSRQLIADAEKTLWLEEKGRFAVSVDAQGVPDAEPLAEQSYFPLWVGWTYASGMRSRRNLESALAELWVGPRRSGSRAESGASRAEIPGMLCAALTEQGQAERIEVIEELLAMAEPAGEWSAFHDTSGKPIPARGGVLDPAVAGLNLDAILYAITGIRCAAIPGFAEKELRLQLTLPKNSRHFTIKSAIHDGRELNLYLRAEGQSLESQCSFDVVLVANRDVTLEVIPTVIRCMGDTHLDWLQDAADHIDSKGERIFPRRISGRSSRSEVTSSLLPRAYLR